MGRGQLTDEIQEKAAGFLDREIDLAELRLYPYIDYCIKNGGCVDRSKISSDERSILVKLKGEGHIDFHSCIVELTKDFYDFMQDILWLAYVLPELEEE